MTIIHIPADVDTDELTRADVLELAVGEGAMEDAHHDMLTEVFGTVTICGLEYDAAQALKDVDPVAYRCSFADYVSEYFQEVDPDDFPESLEEDDSTD